MSLPQVVNQSKNFVITPNSISEAMNYAKLIADSAFCPKEFKGKSGDVLVAMQMGAEVGLSPMQALQNIAVINGRPCLWGDAALAVVISHQCYISHREWFEGSIQEGNLTAFCAITRKNNEEYIKSFSMDDAKKANLWGKAGVWQQYPSRMLQMRARAFCIRDKFADALRGINLREEVEDYEIKPVKNVRPITINSKSYTKREEPQKVEVIEEKTDELGLLKAEFLEAITRCNTEDQLKTVFDEIKKSNFKERPDLFKQLIDAKDAKKNELMVNSFNAEIDAETGEVK